ncbi:MAG TPA: hypothetical protein P5081_21425 [Phycisphaerae bacterium]|nr:hypothetical protein [Phycisphaerae bacterium]HRW55443.1 hypothetical protein [Phycisphaerae bacterium]
MTSNIPESDPLPPAMDNPVSDAASPEPSNKAAPEPPRRKRRWGRRILVLTLLLLLGLVGLVAMTPWALSRPEARNTILGLVNDRIAGDVSFDSLSLSWFDDLEVNGLSIRDADDKDVVSAKRIYLGKGLVGVAQDPTRFAELRIESPQIDIRMDENNRPTIVTTFVQSSSDDAPRSTPETPERVARLPEILGKIVITDGQIRVTPHVGEAQTVSKIDADIDIDSLNAIRGSLAFNMPGGAVTAEANVDNLTQDGELNVCNASGKLRVATNGECELGPLLAMLAPDRQIAGRGTLTVDADFKPAASSAVVAAQVSGLQVANANGAPLEMTLNGDFNLKGTRLDGVVALKGTPGDTNVELKVDTDQAAPSVSADDLVAALLGGKSLKLPAFELSATSRLDLAQVDRALPGVLELQPGQVVRSGVLEVERIDIRGGDAPSVAAVAKLTDANVSREGGDAPVAPMRLQLNARVDDGVGLNVEQLKVDAGFGAIDASGTPKALTCRFNGDLSGARRDLGPFVDLGSADMAGLLEGTLAVKREGEKGVAIDANVNASGVRVRSGAKSFDLNQAAIAQSGRLDLDGNAPTRYQAQSVRVDLDQQIVMSGAGSFDIASRSFDADLRIDRGDLSFLANRADALGAPDLKRFRGQIAGDLKVRGDANNIDTSGKLSATRLTADSRPVLRDKLDVNWKDVAWRNGGEKLSIALASLASQEATVNITDANIDLASGENASGAIKADADLQGVFAALAQFNNSEKPPALKGRLKLDGDIRQSASGFQLVADGGVSQLEIGEGAGAVREDRVDVKLDASVDPKQKAIRLGTNRLSSGLLSAQLAGSIDRYDSDAVADLKGEYSTEWAALTKLLAELSPSSAKLVSVRGTSRSQIALSGPLNRKGDTPPYRAANGAVAVTWDAANIVGIDLTQAKIDMKVEKGEFIVAPTTIGAAQGRVNLSSRYDLASSTLRIPGRVATLDGVKFTPELSRELLSRINPVFYHIVSAEGAVNLTFNNLELPMGERPSDGGGGGKLELKNAKVEPGGVLGELIKLGLATTTGEKISVGLEGADFNVHDGRIHYENFAMIFPYDFDLRFRGSVGLNDTVDLVVSVPVRPELLQRLGVKGPVAQYAEVLTGSRIDIPIAGTRENPKLELSKVATDALIKEAIKRTTEKGAGDALKGLLGGGKDDKSGGKDGKKDAGGKGGKKEKKKGLGGVIPGLGG